MKNRRLRAISLAALLVALIGSGPIAVSAAEENLVQRQHKALNGVTPTLLTDDLKGIVNQPTAIGRTVSSMRANGGKVYLGYGDYAANTGPIDLYSYDGETGASKFEIKVPTETIDSMEEINGSLYLPYTDPKAPWSSPVGYASNRTGSWQLHEHVPMIHHYDMASTDGKNLFMAGSYQSGGKFYAVIWYSADGVNNWQLSMRRESSPVRGEEFDRYYWLESGGGKLYAVADVNGQRYLDIWQNGSWSSRAINATTFNYLNATKGNDVLLAGDSLITKKFDFSGLAVTSKVYSISQNRFLTSADVTADNPVSYSGEYPLDEDETFAYEEGMTMVSYERHGDVVYGLNSIGDIYATQNGRSWKYLMSVGTEHGYTRMTLDPTAGRVYLLASDGGKEAIYSATMPTRGNSVPEITVDSSKLTIPLGGKFDPKVALRASDAEDGDLSAKITERYSLIDSSTPGSYEAVYKVEDSNRATATVKLTVRVAEAAPPAIGSGDRNAMCVIAANGSGQRSIFGGEGCAL